MIGVLKSIFAKGFITLGRSISVLAIVAIAGLVCSSLLFTIAQHILPILFVLIGALIVSSIYLIMEIKQNLEKIMEGLNANKGSE